MIEPHVVWLDDAGGGKISLLGGKGHNLAAMCRTGFPVPAGFCVTTAAYEAVLEGNGLTGSERAPELSACLEREGSWPGQLEAAALSAHCRLGAGAVAVRSSATAEDLPAASFAGQQETLLDVRGKAELLRAIRRCWARFVPQHDDAVGTLLHRAQELKGTENLRDLWSLFTAAQVLNARLLGIHRWSLMHADLFYTALRRLVTRWLGAQRGVELCPRLVAGLANKSVELNGALQEAVSDADWQRFLENYGHRSFSLDIARPTFADAPEQARSLKTEAMHGPDLQQRVAERNAAQSEVRRGLRAQRWGWFKVRLFDWVLRYAQRYMPLREDQRFYWQKTLALQRKLALAIGHILAERGLLACSDDVFFASVEELGRAVEGPFLSPREIASRKAESGRLLRAFKAAPDLCYPRFLRGNQPLHERAAEAGGLMQGQPVSEGVARGPARVVVSPSHLDRVRDGDILVTRGADPGWTPVFGRLAGLVMEGGGQLSHGAVVAREYGLPAVAGIRGAAQLLKDGQTILVDGYSGTVTVASASPQTGEAALG